MFDEYKREEYLGEPYSRVKYRSYKDKAYYKQLHEQSKWEKRERRYEIVRAKRKEPVNLAELYKKESVLVDREWKAIKYGFMDTINAADKEPEDEKDD